MGQVNRWALLVSLILPVLPKAALAEPLREFCPDRPGKDTPPCIVDKGHVILESGALTYAREQDGPRYEIGETLARYGLTDSVELQMSLTPYVVAHLRGENGTRTLRGVGDLTGAVKVNLLNPDGDNTSVAVQAFATAPTGKRLIGSGGWEGGVLLPISFELSEKVGLAFTPELDILANEESVGHHMAFSGVASLSRDLADGLEGSVEIWSLVHREPQNRRTEASLDFALAWRPDERKPVQFDVEVDFGLNHQTPKTEISAGVAVRL